MKKYKTKKFWKNNNQYLFLILVVPLFAVMCQRQEKQSKRDDLNNKIAQVNQEIIESKNLHTANVPKNLRATQTRYNQTYDSLYNCADTLDLCANQNDSLVANAFDKYATRIGRDFQMSAFLSNNDVEIFQKYVSQLDTMDFIKENAKKRILQNNGSMHDLMYFVELFDLDSINTQLNDKLTWKFYTDSNDIEQFELSILCFEKEQLNHAIGKEMNFLNRAWQKYNLQQQLIQNDSARAAELDDLTDSVQCDKADAKYDSINKTILDEFSLLPEYAPNFYIPEFDSIKKQYLHNDSIIKAKNRTFDNMKKLEDTLLQYQQSVLRKRDSLIRKLNAIEK